MINGIILICYQQSTLDYLLKNDYSIKPYRSFPTLYLVGDGKVGILGGWGLGAPALALKLEQLIALGIKNFIGVGTAGNISEYDIGDFILSTKALAEDGVAHHYLNKKEIFAKANLSMLDQWNGFCKNHSFSEFQKAIAWSFSAIFRETPKDILRVKEQGCGIVEMEAATLFAIGTEKGVRTLSLFVISDTITSEEWIPQIKDPKVRNNLHQLAIWALDFCKKFDIE